MILINFLIAAEALITVLTKVRAGSSETYIAYILKPYTKCSYIYPNQNTKLYLLNIIHNIYIERALQFQISSLNAPVVPSGFKNLKNGEVMSSSSPVNNPYLPHYYTLHINRFTHNHTVHVSHDM